MKKYFISLGCLLLSIVSGFSWGAEGHQAIAEAALLQLNPTASNAVHKIFVHSTVPEISNVTTAALWPDEIRISAHPGKLVNTKGAKSFNTRFAGNRVWHFVDYPLDGDYSKDTQFSSETDIVHIIGHCIDVLEGTATGKWKKMKKEEALAWLIHLGGDIHQPLHVGVGFFDFNGSEAILVTDPSKAKGKFTDTGGNSLHFGASGNFHSFWDADMVASISPKETNVVTEILTTLAGAPFPPNTGDHHQWAAAWATDTIGHAKEAYAGIPKANGSVGQKESAHPQIIDIQLVTKDYKTQFGDLVRSQLAKGAFDLADLLNHINWN